MSDPTGDVTRLLHRLGDGDARASDELFPLLYKELRSIAERFMARDSGQQTLQPTALVHEAYLKLLHSSDPDFKNRDHFLAVAAKAMRQILVDRARARATEKRGKGLTATALDQAVILFEQRAIDLVALDESLNELAHMDPQLARMTELRFFGGLDTTETARILEVSRRTVERGWTTTRAWLRARMLPDVETG